MQTFEVTRPTVGAQAIGIARAAYEYALDYAKEREQFGRAIIENQAIAFTLADMKMEIDAARLLVWRAVVDGPHRPSRSPPPRARCSKLKAGEVAVWVTEQAIQILGGNGYTREFPVERMAPRREDLHDLRGHLGDPAARDRPRDLGHADPVTAMRPPTGASIRARGDRLHGHRVCYRTAGEGPVLVLVHGITNSSDELGAGLPLLGAATSRSSRPTCSATATPPSRAATTRSAPTPRGMRDLLVALGHERATIVGHSLGGGIAMQIAYQFPERVERLVLVSSGGLGREVTPAAARRRAARAPNTCCRCWPPSRSSTPGERRPASSRLGLRVGADIAEMAPRLRLAAATTARARRSSTRALGHRHRRPARQRDATSSTSPTDVPTLIIWGDRDPIIPARHGRRRTS